MKAAASSPKTIEENLDHLAQLCEAGFHPAKFTFTLPQGSVPACLSSKALWASFISWSLGPETNVSNLVHAVCGASVGTLFGANSLYGGVSGTNALIKEINTLVNQIKRSSVELSDPEKALLNDRILKLIADIEHPKRLNWGQIVNTAFAWFTATVTSLTFAGAMRDAVKEQPCVPNRSCSDLSPAIYLAVMGAFMWGVVAAAFAYYGQREQSLLMRTKTVLAECAWKLDCANARTAVVTIQDGIDNDSIRTEHDTNAHTGSDLERPLLNATVPGSSS